MKKITLLFLSLFYLSVSLYAQREQDSLALVKLYEATDGDNWRDNTNWLSSEPISTWKGVTLVEDRVVELYLVNNNLNGNLPTEIGNLSALKKLIIVYNPITGNLPSEIGNLLELEWLVLQGNDFSGTIPASIGNLNQLDELTLSENQFSGTIPAALGNLNILTELDLSDNDFSGDLFPEMINLTALERINLSNNSFTSLIDFSSFSNLRYIEVSNNLLDYEDLELSNIDQNQVSIDYENQRTELAISETLDGTEHNLEALYTFSETTYQWMKDNVSMENETNATLVVPEANIGVYNYISSHPNWPDLVLESDAVIVGDLHGGVILSDSLALVDLYNNLDGENWQVSYSDYNGSTNWLSSEPLTRWSGLEIAEGRVISLSLEERGLVGELPSSIGNLDALTHLYLSDNNLSGSIPAEIGNLTNLTELYLDNNDLSGAIPAEIGNLTNLTELDINKNNLSGSIPAEIGNLNKLTLLRLNSNQFSGNLPSEIGNLNQLETFYLRDNALTALTDLSSLTKLTNLGVSLNKLDFEALETTQIDWTTDGFYYSPQNYQLPFTKQTNGSDITLTVNYDYAGTTYQWYKDKQVLINENSKTLTFASSDLGVYQCKANHTDLPNLTLETEAYINGDLHGGVFLSDSLALVAFYNSTNGDNWTDNTYWLSTEDIANWEGVSVSDGRVYTLDLNDNNLSGTLPPEIGNLNYMEEIILWDNAITGVIPSEIGNLNNLEGLYLNNNLFSGSIPTTLGGMSSLTDVWLQKNALSGSIPSEIGNISGLRRFYAEDNQLSGTLPVSLGQLKEIYVLLLNGNKISGALPIEMANMTALKIFHIYDNELTDLTDLSGLTELFDCQVQNNLLDFESIDKAQIDWGGYYSKYNPQNLILPILQSNDGSNYIFDVDYTYSGVTYQWYKDDVLIDGEINQSISFPMTDVGDYYCLVDYASLPNLTLKSETISITSVGIEKPKTSITNVFPNPARDFIRIQMEKPLENNAFLELKNISGNTVLTQNIGGKTQIELQLNKLSKGIYFLQIKNGEDTFVQKVIVE